MENFYQYKVSNSFSPGYKNRFHLFTRRNWASLKINAKFFRLWVCVYIVCLIILCRILFVKYLKACLF